MDDRWGAGWRRPRRARWRGATVAAVALAAGLLVPALPAGGDDPPSREDLAFETGGHVLAVPDPLPDVPAGTVLDQLAHEPGDFPFEVEARTVLYRSTDRFGVPNAVSGIVLVPTDVPAPPGGRGAYAWGHGTTGMTDCAAPSLDAQTGGAINSTSHYEDVTKILAAGHVVIASDYPGLGTPGVHPWHDGIGVGRAVLDSIRAARAFGATGPAVIDGFSQGGHASLFAAQQWRTYAPDIDLRGAVGVATSSHVELAFAARDHPASQGYIELVLFGILAGRPDLDRTQILTSYGQDAYDDFAAGADLPPGPFDPNEDGWVGCSFLGDVDVDRALRTDPRTVPAWARAFEENHAGQARIDTPVLMVHSEGDDQALVGIADIVCRDLEANGTDVRMWRYDDEGHVGTVVASTDDRGTWALDRLAGRPLTDGVDFVGEAPDVLPTCPAGPTDPTDPRDPGEGPPRSAPPATPVPGPARLTG